MNIEDLKELYVNTNKKSIKRNLRICMAKYGFTPSSISEEMSICINTVYSWTNIASRNVPLFEDAERISEIFGFEFGELVEERVFR